jgi:hypothetical protein
MSKTISNNHTVIVENVENVGLLNETNRKQYK